MKQFINADTIANDARMRRSVWKAAFLFVEGESDERFYGIFVDPDRCQIIVSHGRERLIDACETLNADAFTGFLGIVDADFRHAQQTVPTMPNLLVTDFHDVECFMLRGDAFDRVLGEFVSKDKLERWIGTFGPDVRGHLLVHSVNVGLLVWHSIANDLNLSFSNLEAKEFADRDSVEVNLRCLIEHTKHKSQRHDLDTNELISEIAKIEKFCSDPWQVVRGCDFIDLFGYALRHALATRPAAEVSRERLEQSLRLAYTAEEFATTELFKAIKEWERANRPYIILRVLATATLLEV